MAVYTYKAMIPGGEVATVEHTGTLSADTPHQARHLLRQRGLTVEHLAEVKSRPRRWAGRGRDRTKVTVFARELSTLLAVGTPLTDAIQTIASQHTGSFRSTLLLLRERVSAGSSMASAMAAQPAVFDELCVSLIGVGEDAGSLDVALERLARFRERREQFQGKLGTALLYPCVVLVTAIAVSIFLMTYVVPSILQPLLEQGRSLPLPTRIVKSTSDFLVGWGWLAALAALGMAMLWGVLVHTRRGRWFWDSFILRLPLVGALLKKAAVVRIVVVLQTLLENGVVFVRALQVAQKSTRNVVLREAMARCESAVCAGRDIAPALQAAGAFPPLVVQVFSVGQQSGRLEEMLQRLARDYDEQVAAAAQRVAAVLEPVLILLLAIVVATIALATMLPILEAGDVLG